MKIKLERSGGFANIRLTHEVDTKEISAEQASELKNLVKSVKPFEKSTEETPKGKVADQFQYKLTFEEEDKVKTVQTTDSDASEDLTNLIDWLNQDAIAHQKKQIERNK